MNAQRYVFWMSNARPTINGARAMEAPITTDNVVGYVDDGFYEGTTFHRIISNVMIQVGGLLPD